MKCIWPVIPLFTTIALLVFAQPDSHAQHLHWQNFTIEDGLPNNRVYHALQDQKGFIWFATDQGLASFNGYEFSKPVDPGGRSSNEVFKIVEDQQGRIWTTYLDATLSYVENDTMYRWDYNYLLDSLYVKFVFSGDFDIDPDGTIWCALSNLGFLKVKPDGSFSLTPLSDRNVLIIDDVNGKSMIGLLLKENNQRLFSHPESISNLKSGVNLSLADYPSVGQIIGSYTFHSCLLRNGNHFICYDNLFCLLDDDKLSWIGHKELKTEFLREQPDGSLLLGAIGNKFQGLLYYSSIENFFRDEYENLLPGHKVTSFLSDREGGWWVTTLDAGIFYCKNPGLKIYDKEAGFSNSKVKFITSDQKNVIYAGLMNGEVLRIETVQNKISKLPSYSFSEGDDITLLEFDSLTHRLWISPLLSYLDEDTWKQIKRANVSLKNRDLGIVAKTLTLDPSGEEYWGSLIYEGFHLSRQGDTAKVFTNRLGGERFFSVQPDVDKRIWMTTINGLMLWQNNTLELPQFDDPGLYKQARDLKLLPDNSLVILLKGNGILIWKKNGIKFHITRKTGLISDQISGLYVSTKGSIYAISNEGLSKVEFTQDDSYSIKTITTKNGLPSDRINDVELLNDELWIATDKGLVRMNSEYTGDTMVSPRLEKFKINNQEVSYLPEMQLTHRQSNIAIKFIALHFRSGGDIPYRYKMTGHDTAFTLTHERDVHFASLAAGKYNFEVQAQNEDGIWSKSSFWVFEINPAWWQTIWFRILMVLSFMGAVWIFFESRLKSSRRETAHHDQIRELQASALRAQMNPHFIFNSLSSIQQFIVQNDQQSASRYLARFARLIRLALHGSVDGKHTLRKEVEMLENYLMLEQLRFRNKFDFAIKLQEGIQTEEIFIPPMLIQPIVENSILHGLREGTVKGMISIEFTKEEKDLIATVTDNGQGFILNTKVIPTGSYKSVGIKLTQQRLDVLSLNSSKNTYIQENLTNHNNEITGSFVRIRINTT